MSALIPNSESWFGFGEIYKSELLRCRFTEGAFSEDWAARARKLLTIYKIDERVELRQVLWGREGEAWAVVINPHYRSYMDSGIHEFNCEEFLEFFNMDFQNVHDILVEAHGVLGVDLSGDFSWRTAISMI